jgi:hypothetical protein
VICKLGVVFNVDAYGVAGVHRNLGSHISRVRSLHLDTWSQDTLALMAAVGNTASNRCLHLQHIRTHLTYKGYGSSKVKLSL